MRNVNIAPREALTTIHDGEEKLNLLLRMINPKLHQRALTVQQDLRSQPAPSGYIAQIWNSLFPCAAVISNGLTPLHRDSRGEIDVFDMLLSCGSADDSVLKLPDLKATLRYDPGTVIFLYGRGLMHEVPAWKEGEDRCGWAHFLRGAQIRKLGLGMPGFMVLNDFLKSHSAT
jgi:hypothetical protein